jgi:hypothetical protein
LLITEGVFERYYVNLELESALEYGKNIIVIWDKDHCPVFPKKEEVSNSISSILDIKAIIWQSEISFKEIIINEINNNIKITNQKKFLNLIKKNNYKQIIIDPYIKKYVKNICNYDISKLIFSSDPRIFITTDLKIKKSMEFDYPVNLVLLSIFVDIKEDDNYDNEDTYRIIDKNDKINKLIIFLIIDIIVFISK